MAIDHLNHQIKSHEITMLQVPVRLISAMINACIAALAAVMTLGHGL